MKTRRRLPADDGAGAFQSKEEFVADYLREAILSGHLPRGARLKQALIARELGMSITPVREALKLLAAEGYVLGATHRGARVAPFDATNALETVELRATLEPRLAAAALRRMTLGEMEQVQRLAQAHERAAAAGDVDAERRANWKFHRFLYGLAHQPQTLRFALVLWARYPFDALGATDGAALRAARDHADIMDAIVSRNAEAVELAMRRHITAGWEALRARLA